MKSPIKSKKTKFGSMLSFSSMEAYSLLKTNILFSLSDGDKNKVIGITSPNPQEGKSYIAINLAYVLANDDHKVILIDGDMRKPTVASKLELEESEGLSNVLIDSKVDDVILKGVLNDNLDIMLAGDIPPNPAKLLGSDSMLRLINRLKVKYDYIIVDLPPVNVVVDPITVSKFLDGIAIVVRNNQTKKRDVNEAVRRIRVSGVDIIGFVYNDFGKNLARSSYYRNYGKYYSNGYYSKGYYSRGYYRRDDKKDKREDN